MDSLGYNRVSGCPPFRQSVPEPPRGHTTLAKQMHRLEREDAIGTTTIGDDLAVVRKFPEASLQFCERHVACARQVSGLVFVLRPHVEERDGVVAQAPQQLVAADRLQGIEPLKIAADHFAGLGDTMLGQVLDGRDGFHDRRIRQPVDDVLPLATGGHQAKAPKLLQMLGDIGEGKAGALGKDLDRALALTQMLQQLESVLMPERTRDGGEMRKDLTLRGRA